MAEWDWSWLSAGDRARFINQIDQLKDIVKLLSTSEKSDTWRWEGDPSGSFSVKSLRIIIDNVLNSPFAGPTSWSKRLPPPAKTIWSWLFNWCEIKADCQNSPERCMCSLVDSASLDKKMMFFRGCNGCALWRLWNSRND
ncbi:hypothetical protein OSB04_011137 [Centaurea solstitialis]|uniref:Uncharacterized protein n=1 Tax=Centaurea solstitialis TaxID=347529 RepID=A0AA38TTL9_9ASTR|nr:hypothetical protein OSB04_011137 [Centaurea solstitialis]